jgi:hypothetical protein
MNTKLQCFYLENIYEKLSKENFTFYTIITTHHYINCNEAVFALKKDDNLNHNILRLNLQRLSKEQFVNSNRFFSVKSLRDENGNDIGIKYLIDFLNMHPNLQKDFINFFSYDFKKNYKIIVDQLAKNKEDILKIISYFSIKGFNVSSVNPYDLVDYLKEKKLDRKQIDSCLYLFYKSRVNQLKPLNVASNIRSFLLKEFNEDETVLKKYFEFLPLLESYFKDEKINVFIDDYKHITALKVNVTDLIKLMAMEKWSIINYEDNFKILIKGIASSYDVEECIFSKESVFDNKKQRILTVNMFHNNAMFNEKKLKENIMLFVDFVKANPTFEITEDNIVAWSLKTKLESNLDIIINKDVKKIKIKI